jgi:hypothetical protein
VREKEGDGATAVRFDSRHDPHSLACDRPSPVVRERSCRRLLRRLFLSLHRDRGR